MKKCILMIAVLAMSALAMVSCKKDKINENEKAVDGEKVTFHATIAETVCTAEGEKTHINFNNFFVFDDGDLFGVYSTEMGNEQNGGFKCHIYHVDESNGDFNFDLDGVDWPYNSDPSIAAYPYKWKTNGSYKAWFNTDSDGNVTVQYGFPPTQDYREGNVDSDTYPMIGWYDAEKNWFDFYPFMSLLKVNIKGYAKVESIVLEDKNHDLIGRTAPMIVTKSSLSDFGKEGFDFIGQNSNTITLNCMPQYTNYRAVELKPEGTDFYFVVPAGTLEHFTLKVVDERGDILLTQPGAIKDGAKSRTIHTLVIPGMIGSFDFDGLCLTSNSDGSKVRVTGYQNLQNVNLQMCKESADGQMSNWGNVSEQEISLGQDEKLYFKNNSSSLSTSLSNYAHFEITGDVAASGNIMSLLNNTSLEYKDYCFNHLFAGCEGLTSIDNLSLPSNTLTRACYQSMFEGCVGLTEIPNNILQAENLAPSCYTSMFKGCTSLSSVYNLDLTNETCVYCYESMFEGCSNLTYCDGFIEINADAKQCCMNMFNGCSALTTAPILTIEVAPSYGFQSMFNGCTALVDVYVDITAETVGKCSYYSMFNGCAKLQRTRPQEYGPMVLPATVLSERCYYRMFSGCRKLETPIEIMAEDVSAVNCCESMFTFCKMLPSVTVHFTEWPANGTLNWFNQVTSYGTFHCPEGLPYEYGISRIPEYWNVMFN